MTVYLYLGRKIRNLNFKKHGWGRKMTVIKLHVPQTCKISGATCALNITHCRPWGPRTTKMTIFPKQFLQWNSGLLGWGLLVGPPGHLSIAWKMNHFCKETEEGQGNGLYCWSTRPRFDLQHYVVLWTSLGNKPLARNCPWTLNQKLPLSTVGYGKGEILK